MLTERMAHTERTLRANRFVAILRGDFKWADVTVIAEALLQSGFSVLEYTWNSPDAARVVTRLNTEYGNDLIVGAGTLLSGDDVQEAAAAGARFLITPHWSVSVSAAAQAADLLLLPGVFTPSEVQAARSHGWRLLKLFPANVGGPGHLKALKGPFHDVDFIPTGGVELANAGSFLKVGAVAVAVGSSLFRPGVQAEELTAKLRELRILLDGFPEPRGGQGQPA